MWIFTETGFVSAVRHHSEKDKLVVRARDQKSLESLSNYVGLEIISTPSNDYPYRVFVADSVFATWLSKQTMAVEYTNFKDRVHDTREDIEAHTGDYVDDRDALVNYLVRFGHITLTDVKELLGIN